MPEQTPGVGRIVHYVSHGTPKGEDGTQAYSSQCRAAVVTETGDANLGEHPGDVGLCVLNPTGLAPAPTTRTPRLAAPGTGRNGSDGHQ